MGGPLPDWEGAAAAVDDVIMDEFHYYSDHERGVAWQVPLLTMPQARFLLMSATLGDTAFFERTLRELTGVPCVLVQSDQRPVPLEFDYSTTPLEEKIEELVDFPAFYLVSQMVLRGEAAASYVFQVLFAEPAYAETGTFMPWTYPPPALLLVAPFSLLPTKIAYLIFVTVSLGLFLFVIHRIAGRASGLVLVAMMPAVLSCLSCGQTGFLGACCAEAAKLHGVPRVRSCRSRKIMQHGAG